MFPAEEVQVYRARIGRVAYFDNAKLALMACVVVGHLLKTGGALKRHYARALFVLIYSFHMPVFIFLAGLFIDRRSMSRSRVVRRAALFFFLGVLAKVLRSASSWVWGRGFTFTPFAEVGLPWFMFTLSAFYVIAWLLRRADSLLVLGISVIVALLAGYVNVIGDVFCLSRIIVFFPFFWMGHVLRPKDVRRFFALKAVRCTCAVVLVGCAALCCWRTHSFYVMRRLFLGRLCYAKTHIANCSALHRLMTYGISVVVGTAVLGVIPQRRIPWVSEAGQRTLQVYLLHLEVVDAMRYLHLSRRLVRLGRWGWLLLVPVGIVLTLVLAFPDLTRFLRLERDGARGDEGIPVQ